MILTFDIESTTCLILRCHEKKRMRKEEHFNAVSAYLLILASTFSEDMITTGVSFNEEEKKGMKLLGSILPA